MSEHHRTSEWVKARNRAKPRLAAEIEQGGGQCVNCGRWIPPGTPRDQWDVGHRMDAAVLKEMGWTSAEINHPDNLGPSHNRKSGLSCNQKAGGRLGNQMQQAKRKKREQEEGDHFKW